MSVLVPGLLDRGWRRIRKARQGCVCGVGLLSCKDTTG